MNQMTQLYREGMAELREENAKLTARIAELEAENDRLQSGWFRDETICPDGSLRPKVSDLLNRIAELEYQLEDLAEDYKARIAELEAALSWKPKMNGFPRMESDERW